MNIHRNEDGSNEFGNYYDNGTNHQQSRFQQSSNMNIDQNTISYEYMTPQKTKTRDIHNNKDNLLNSNVQIICIYIQMHRNIIITIN